MAGVSVLAGFWVVSSLLQAVTQSIPSNTKTKTRCPDFLMYYGTMATAAGVIIPKNYYLSLGSNTQERDEKFAQAPIGAGPYKFVRQEPGIEVEFTAFADYWRKIPHVKTIISRGIRELPVRGAALMSGGADFAYFISGELLQSLINDPKLRYHPNNSAPF